jgi:CRISP-associated protein Cas1
MFSIPDIEEKQILFINTSKENLNELKFSNDNLVYKKNGQISNQASCHKIIAVFICGEFTISSKLIKEALEHGVSLYLLKWNLEYLISINSFTEANYLLRQKQYALSPEQELVMAKKIIFNKILNQSKLLRQQNRSFQIEDKNRIQTKIDHCRTNQELLGIEGLYSKNFFQDYFKDFKWYKRLPQAKIDEINLLMDVGYNMLFNITDGFLKLFGFDTYKGVYHQLFFARKSLACDLMEPLRSIIDKEIHSAFNLKQIDAKDFKQSKGRFYLPYDKTTKYTTIFLKAIMKNKVEIFTFIQQYYRHIMNPEKNKFPSFTI